MNYFQIAISLLLLLHTVRSESSEAWNYGDLPREISDEEETAAESISNHKWSPDELHHSNGTHNGLYLGEAFERLVAAPNVTTDRDNDRLSRTTSTDEWSKDNVKKAAANSTRGRSGRELDLDALLDGTGKHHEPGERESRILNDPPTGKGLAIQGFIPVLGLGAAAAAGAAMASSAAASHQLVQQSFQKHSSHVPYHYGQPKQQGGGALSSRLQAFASSLSPINKFNRRRHQQPGPMSPQSLLGSSQGIDYSQFASQCTCVPFYMCKAGYIEQEARSTGQPDTYQYGPIMRMQPTDASQMNQMQSQLQSSHLAAALLAQAEKYQQLQLQQQQQQQQEQQRGNHGSMMAGGEAAESIQNMYPNANSGPTSTSNSNSDLELPIDERSVDGSDKTHFNAESLFNQTDFEALGRMLGFGSNKDNQAKNTNQCGMLRTCCPLLSAAEMMSAQQFLQSTFQMNNQFGSSHSSHGNHFGSPSHASIVNHVPVANPPSFASALPSNFNSYSSSASYPSVPISVPPSPYGFPTHSNDYYAKPKPTNSIQNWQSQASSAQFLNRQRTGFSLPVDPFAASVISNRFQANQQPQCGIRPDVAHNQARVLNQQNLNAGLTEFGEFPWQAALLKRLGPADSLFVCGATLISQDWVATAAHCIKKNTADQLKVRLGEHDVHREDEYYPHIERNVIQVIKHPQFYPGTLANDIALLRLEPVSIQDAQKTTPHIVPVCLPYPGENFANQRCWVAGWGKDAFGPKGDYQSVLRKVDVPVIGHSQCNARLRQTRLGPLFDLHAGFMCAGGEAGKDACEGDGGSALVCEVNGVWKAAGLVSWGLGCGKAGMPGVYVNVGHYSRWIDQVMNSADMSSAHVHSHVMPSFELNSLQRQSGQGLDERATGMMNGIEPASIINERSNGNSDELSLPSNESSESKTTSGNGSTTTTVPTTDANVTTKQP